jgi:hypothetical protein
VDELRRTDRLLDCRLLGAGAAQLVLVQEQATPRLLHRCGLCCRRESRCSSSRWGHSSPSFMAGMNGPISVSQVTVLFVVNCPCNCEGSRASRSQPLLLRFVTSRSPAPKGSVLRAMGEADRRLHFHELRKHIDSSRNYETQ